MRCVCKGVLLACYLVFTSRMSADQAILFVRAKRANSIQTRGQLLCVREFAQFLVPLRSIFSCAEPKGGAVTLSQYLIRQRHMLHGYEARQMKNVPKVVQLVCRLLTNVAANQPVVVEETWLEIPDLTAEVEKTVSQRALQQLGKEMRGKGIPVSPFLPDLYSPSALQSAGAYDQPLVSDNDLDPLWRQQNAVNLLTSSLTSTKSLSYSDSVLYKCGPQRHHMATLRSDNLPVHCLITNSLSHSSLTTSVTSPQDTVSSIPADTGSPSLKKQLLKGRQSLSLDEHRRNSASPALSRASKPLVHERQSDAAEGSVGGVGRGDRVDVSKSVQSELSPESRRLLVAKALAMDLTDKDLTSKVSRWQVRGSCDLR